MLLLFFFVACSIRVQQPTCSCWIWNDSMKHASLALFNRSGLPSFSSNSSTICKQEENGILAEISSYLLDEPLHCFNRRSYRPSPCPLCKSSRLERIRSQKQGSAEHEDQQSMITYFITQRSALPDVQLGQCLFLSHQHQSQMSKVGEHWVHQIWPLAKEQSHK